MVGLLATLVAVGWAMGHLFSYKSAPGLAGAPKAVWPAASRVVRTPGLPTLVMFAHPMCPCTRASIGELRELVSRLGGRVATHVLFLVPEGTGSEWKSAGSWSAVREIQGVEVAEDLGGREAALFGAETSGHVLLYDGSGELLFSGGITSARGHMGDNAGVDGIEAFIAGAPSAQSATPVFGCPLDEPVTAAANDEVMK